MKNYESSVDKGANKAPEDENTHGYIPRRCNFKCYKCRYRGICVIPRKIIETEKRVVRNNLFGNTTLLNNKYRLNGFLSIRGYKRRLLRYLNSKKKKSYDKDSEKKCKNGIFTYQ